MLTQSQRAAYEDVSVHRGPLQICSPEWLQQHEALQRLNMQEHHSVMKHTDEFVKEAILDEEKLAVLVHELLAIEVRASGATFRCHSVRAMA